MHVLGNQSHQSPALDVCELSADQNCELLQLADVRLVPVAQLALCVGVEVVFFGYFGPVDCVQSQHDLQGELEHPVATLGVLLLLFHLGGAHEHFQRLLHLLLQGLEPVLHLVAHSLVLQGRPLALRRYHCDGVVRLRVEFQLDNILEALPEVRHDGAQTFGLG